MPTPAAGHARSAGFRRQERVKIARRSAPAERRRRQGLVKIASKEVGARDTLPAWWTHDGAGDRRDGSIPG